MGDTTVETGRKSEDYVIENYGCPYCEQKLSPFDHKNKPLYDARCSNCLFMVQIKSYYRSYEKVKNNKSHPILSSTYAILKKVLTAGILPSPLIVHYRADDMVVFYPFITERDNIEKRRKPVKGQYYYNYSIKVDTPRVILNKKKSS